MGGRVFRNNYKGYMDKTNGGWKQGREGGFGWGQCGEVVEGKCRKL